LGFPLFSTCYAVVFPVANLVATAVHGWFTNGRVEAKTLVSASLQWALIGLFVATCFWLLQVLDRKVAAQKARCSSP
jgi:hypothetical protein